MLEETVSIVHQPAFTVIGMEWDSTGSAGSISDLWGRFLVSAHELKRKIKPELSYGLCIPASEGQTFTYVAGYEVEKDSPLPDGMVRIEVPEQAYARFIHKGDVRRISETMGRIYSSWLSQAGLVPASGMDLERYDQRFLGGDHPDSETDLLISIQSADN